MPRVQIRPLKGDAEYRQCEFIQKAVWGTLGVSSELLSVTQKYGGAVLGCLHRGKVVGFLYAFLARRHGRLVHWSHMMAVEEEYRNLGLGFRMKMAHRKFALRQGLSAICWTFDPLQSRNATLNIARLGGRVDEYIPDCYGQFPSRIEQGLPSDRFAVEWRIRSAGVQQRLSRPAGPETPAGLASLPRVNETYSPPSHHLIANRRVHLNLQASRLLVEIPSHTDLMRRQELRLARRWRMETRRLFTHYLRARYRVTHFVPPRPETEDRCFYILGRSSPR